MSPREIRARLDAVEDLPAIRARLAAHVLDLDDSIALLAEVDRLTAALDLSESGRRDLARTVTATVEGAIVAWLREGPDPGRGTVAWDESVGAIRDELADAIEDGEHYPRERRG